MRSPLSLLFFRLNKPNWLQTLLIWPPLELSLSWWRKMEENREKEWNQIFWNMSKVQYDISECWFKVLQSTEKKPSKIYLHAQKQSSLETVGLRRVSKCISSLLSDCNLPSKDLSKANYKTQTEKRSLIPCNEYWVWRVGRWFLLLI